MVREQFWPKFSPRIHWRRSRVPSPHGCGNLCVSNFQILAGRSGPNHFGGNPALTGGLGIGQCRLLREYSAPYRSQTTTHEGPTTFQGDMLASQSDPIFRYFWVGCMNLYVPDCNIMRVILFFAWYYSVRDIINFCATACEGPLNHTIFTPHLPHISDIPDAYDSKLSILKPLC